MSAVKMIFVYLTLTMFTEAEPRRDRQASIIAYLSELSSLARWT